MITVKFKKDSENNLIYKAYRQDETVAIGHCEGNVIDMEEVLKQIAQAITQDQATSWRPTVVAEWKA